MGPSESPRGWLQGEPEIEEMLRDPIVHLVMARDGLTPQGLRRILRASGARLMAAPGRAAAAEPRAPAPLLDG